MKTPIYIIDLETFDIIKEYQSIREATRENTKLDQGGISQYLDSGKAIYGYLFYRVKYFNGDYDKKIVQRDYENAKKQEQINRGTKRKPVNIDTKTNQKNIEKLKSREIEKNFQVIDRDNILKNPISNNTLIQFKCANGHRMIKTFVLFMTRGCYECSKNHTKSLDEKNKILESINLIIYKLKDGYTENVKFNCYVYKCIKCGELYDNISFQHLEWLYSKKNKLFCCDLNTKKKGCQEPNCSILYPTYNFEGEIRGLYCAEHALPNMINIKIDRCIECGKSAQYGDPIIKKKTHCSPCKLPSMVDLFKKPCEICGDYYLTKDSPYYPLCFKCYIYKNPDFKPPRNYKTKQFVISDIIKKKYNDTYPMIFDKQLSGKYVENLYRPDIIINLPTHYLIVEVDENQHRYNTCDLKRIFNIRHDLDKPLYIIRFNPDKYDDINESMFRKDKNGKQLEIRKIEFNKRMEVLINTIEFYLHKEEHETELVQFIYLYYDNNYSLSILDVEMYYEYLKNISICI